MDIRIIRITREELLMMEHDYVRAYISEAKDGVRTEEHCMIMIDAITEFVNELIGDTDLNEVDNEH